MRADAVFNAVGAAMHHPNPTIIHSERLGADLRDDGFKPLSHGGASSYYFDVSVCMNIDARAVGRSQPALFNIHGQAEADVLARAASSQYVALELVPFAACKRFVQKTLIVTGIEHHLVTQVRSVVVQRASRVRADQIAPPHLDPRKTNFPRNSIHQPLADKIGLIAAR